MKPKNYQERQDVLGLALDLHMWTTGSGPGLSNEDRDFAIKFIRTRLSGWNYPPRFSEVFDSAVKTLLTIAVREAEEHKEAGW